MRNEPETGQLNRLRELAEQALVPQPDEVTEPSDQWLAAASPDVILALLSEREHLLSMIGDQENVERSLDRSLAENQRRIAELERGIRILQDNWPKTIPAPMDYDKP